MSSHPKYGIWLKRTDEIYNQVLENNKNFEPRPYQVEHAALYCMRRFNLCNGSMGSGKSLISGLTIAAIYRTFQDRKPGSIHILVTSRDAALTRWMVDLQYINELAKDGVLEFIDSEKQVLNSKAAVWIYTHDFLKRQAKNCPRSKHPFMSDLMLSTKRQPSMMVIDEIHNINSKTLRSKHVEKLARKAKRKLALSGTLSDGKLGKIHHSLKLIYGPRIEMTERMFVRYFSNRTKLKTNYLTGEDEESTIQLSDRYLVRTKSPRSS